MVSGGGECYETSSWLDLFVRKRYINSPGIFTGIYSNMLDATTETVEELQSEQKLPHQVFNPLHPVYRPSAPTRLSASVYAWQCCQRNEYNTQRSQVNVELIVVPKHQSKQIVLNAVTTIFVM